VQVVVEEETEGQEKIGVMMKVVMTKKEVEDVVMEPP
jgi:hypothetical protein